MTPRHLRLPPDRFYWAVLEVPGAKGRLAASPAVLMQMLEPEVPLPPADLHAAFARLDAGRVLACAFPKAEIESIDAVSLKPANAPDLFGAVVDVDALELLNGPYLPRPVRRERSRRWSSVLAAVVLVGALVCAGLARRAVHERAWVRAADAAATSVLATSLGRPTDLNTGAQLLRDELESQRRLRRRSPDTPDAAAALADALTAFPRGGEFRTELVSVTPATVSLSVTIPGDAQPFLRSLQSWPGWTLDEPRLTQDAASSRISVQFRRKENVP